MISKECREIADENRVRFDFGRKDMLEFPEGCECACQHMMPQQWDKMFSIKPPWQAELNVKELL